MTRRPEVIDDPDLGQSRPHGEWPKRCSICLAEIPDETVPLMLWSQDRERMWVYCWQHEPWERLAKGRAL